MPEPTLLTASLNSAPRMGGGLMVPFSMHNDARPSYAADRMPAVSDCVLIGLRPETCISASQFTSPNGRLK